jgi:flagella basal body P-ring formation protein FlgA
MLSRLSLAALLALCALQPLGASERPRLRAEATVSSTLVRLGDLVEGVGKGADEPIFRAPDLGTAGTVRAARVVAAARDKAGIEVDAAGIVEVRVSRASRTILLDEMDRVLRAAIEARFGAQASIVFDPQIGSRHVEPHLSTELVVDRLTWNETTGRFDAELRLDGSEALRRTPLLVSGSATATIEVPTFTRALTRGEIVGEGDVALERRPRRDSLAAVISAPALAIGQAVRRPVRPGQPVVAADLMKPEIVARNQLVTLLYETPGMVLTIRAKALEAGAEGDTVPVLNAQSSRVVQAVVTGPGRVTVAAAPRIALQ